MKKLICIVVIALFLGGCSHGTTMKIAGTIYGVGGEPGFYEMCDESNDLILKAEAMQEWEYLMDKLQIKMGCISGDDEHWKAWQAWSKELEELKIAGEKKEYNAKLEKYITQFAEWYPNGCNKDIVYEWEKLTPEEFEAQYGSKM